MKKRVLSILLVAAMTASLTACGGSDSSNNSASGSGEICYVPSILEEII